MAVGSFMFLTVDCADPAVLGTFWSEVLGTETDSEMDDGRFLFLKGSATLPVLCFQRVEDPRAGKNRLHLDVSVADLDAATERILALGGSWPGEVERTLEGFRWRTVADPEGNEFDLAVG